MSRIAFVPLRYGNDVVGGSEGVVREAAQGFSERGWEVEILTTTFNDLFSLKSAYETGTTKDGDLTVRRFPAVISSREKEKTQLSRRIIAGETLTQAEEIEWLNAWFRLPDLFHFLVQHREQYDAIVFSPYLFWHTVAGCQAAPERSIVMPCFHDETYAYLDMYKTALSGAAGTWFLADPERDLGHKLGAVGQKEFVTGAGIHPPAPDAYRPDEFRKQHKLTKPFVLYAGRREAGKGWNLMLEQYASAVRAGIDLDLVSIGSNEIDVPNDIVNRVHDLGFVENEELPSAFAAASALVQPSTNESFSRSIMEAWLAGTPVIANYDGAVVRWHCERSKAGLVYRDGYEFAECLRLVAEKPEVANAIAKPGREYVLENYNWSTVLDRMETSIKEMI